VAVIGGGIAGVSAAAAAARAAVSVVLVERFAFTGGVLTAGGVGNWCGETVGNGEVFDEIQSGLMAFGALGSRKTARYNTIEQLFDHEILAVVLQELLIRRQVRLLLHTRFVDVNVSEDGRIHEAIVCGPSGPEALRAKQWIDCTGEASVAHQAGFKTMKGRPEDGMQLAMSLMCFVREVNCAVKPQVPVGWFEPSLAKEDLPRTSVWPNGPGGKALKIWVPKADSTDTESMTAAEVRGRRSMMQVLDYFQRIEKKPWRLDHCSTTIGIREGRRIVGDYVLSAGDVRVGRAFEDGVARGTFYLDAHRSDDDKCETMLSEDERCVPPYQIPLRSLIARDGVNLWMAGRCFSADQLALSSARVATSGSMMGQAAGIGAALAVQRECDIRDLDARRVVRAVIERGAKLDVTTVG
jgi:hypothetical protein